MYLLADTFVPHTKAYIRMNLDFFPRHSGAGRNPGRAYAIRPYNNSWMPVFTGMTDFTNGLTLRSSIEDVGKARSDRNSWRHFIQFWRNDNL